MHVIYMALSVLLVLLHLSPVAVAAAAGKSPRGLEVRVEDGRLSVRLDAAPLETVLRMIAEQAGVVIKADGDLDEVRPQSFTEIPLIQGIRWLAGDRLLVMVYGKDRGSGSRLVEVRVYATRPENSAEASAKKSTMFPHIGALPVGQPDSRPAVTARYAELARLGRGKRLEEVSYLAYADDDEAAVATLTELLARDPDPSIRRAAVTALSNARGQEAAAALTVALEDDDGAVRVQALRGLAAILGEQAAAVLGGVVQTDVDPVLRRMAVDLAAGLQGSGACQVLEQALDDPNESVGEAAAAALERFRQ